MIATIQPLSTVPQAVYIFRHHDATSISIVSWVLYLVFDLMWLWYGLNEKQRAIIVSAAMFSFLEAVVVVGALMYGGKW